MGVFFVFLEGFLFKNEKTKFSKHRNREFWRKKGEYYIYAHFFSF